MGSRGQITELLNQVENDIKSLKIAYEQYFMGIEQRAPEQQRQKLTVRVRKLVTHYIPQTDLRFRMQSITSSFNSYAGHWDRTLRLIDEGRYERHTSRIQRRANEQSTQEAIAVEKPISQIDSLYKQLVSAHQYCKLRAPNREQVLSFLTKQEETIKKRFGDKKVDFVVVTEAGKPKIKVRVKKEANND